ncbi:2-oxoacid:acceptor oxidoreductase family protein [Actinotalea sp. K2]|uniref:2-oxoacid:acceptor oxidoreductase family protein n=1 Tax=Actinotalea sp. K2 TaxID=2939438 RepID=UPI002016D751|nr:2-oxoacid:acceptor oxidoreductase family protein [Actinotalea sp. K2]MCL3862367.1 2-oxoacid:acceptor oxidoreductase family protein [Actinotalea sp. K2]
MSGRQARYPGIPVVINGNGAVAHVMKHVCGGVIGYPITPSTEIAELYEAARAEGSVNVWGKHPFFFETEGEHSAQSGALGAALTGGQYISNASSSQGILYAMESHYVTVGKKIGGFVLQVAARVVSKHSLNVMAGHDDVYALLPSGYTVLFGANPQQAADLAAISYRTSALSLIPVANAMDGFATSHMLSEVLLPEPELLHEYLGDPEGSIPSPTVAQEILFGAAGRVAQLTRYLERIRGDLPVDDLRALTAYLDARADQVEMDGTGSLLDDTLPWLPEEVHGAWRRQWLNATTRGTRKRVPSLVDLDNPGMTGPVQNQPDFQAGAVDHRTHFAADVPDLVRRAMREYSSLTGRHYAPLDTDGCTDADYVLVGLGSIADDVRAVLPHLRAQGLKVGLVQVTLLQPFPEAELVAALRQAKHVTVLERSDQTALTSLVTQALFRARANAEVVQHAGLPAIDSLPRLTTAIFGLGGHDVQPRHLVAVVQHMADGGTAPLVYLGSQFFSADPSPKAALLEDRLRTAYPGTQQMALRTGPNPVLLPPSAIRVRFHSIGGYGTVATGKLLTDILAGVLGMHSRSAPKYGSEKSGAPTSYYITLSPEPVLLTNAELEDVEVVVSPDHRAFAHTNPLKGLVPGGTFILQTDLSPEKVWRELPQQARRTIRERRIRFLVVDAFAVAKRHAPTPELETRMMGIAFIGAVTGHVDRVTGDASPESIDQRVRTQITKKFGSKGTAVVEGNMAVIRDGMEATRPVRYDTPELLAIDAEPVVVRSRSTVAMSAQMCPTVATPAPSGLFDPDYFETATARPFREGTIGEAPVLPGAGLFMPVGTAATKDKGLFRRSVPSFDPDRCTGCLECALACPDAAIPNTVHEIPELLESGIARLDLTDARREELRRHVHVLAEGVRESYRQDRTPRAFADVVADVAVDVVTDDPFVARALDQLVARLARYPVARTRPFFDAMEKAVPGTGGLYAAVVDPWKCTGCLECVEVCGPGALTPMDQDSDVLATLEDRFDVTATAPPTPRRFFEGSTAPGGDVKRLLLDHRNYYATTGGHGACRGCGEVTAIRLLMATSHALGSQRRQAHLRELGALLDRLHALHDRLDADADADRRARVTATIATLDRRLYRYEGGPTGHGPASTVVANSTGCSSVYSSTMPFNCYLDPWVNSLFQDAQPLAKGIFEGLCAQALPDVVAWRRAHLELEDAYQPTTHDKQLQMLSWERLTPQEIALLPTVLTIGGDGASYDIGFGAMSRVLASSTPVKMLVLDSGAYSNTGGQASTASFTGQDSDLARFGGEHVGKLEARKELALLASFHPDVFVCATSTALHGHFLGSALEMLTYTAGPAVMDVYTPCGSENGVPEAASNARSRLAVESRMNPVFVHDPRRGPSLHDRYSLEGNPDIEATWTTTTLEHVDDEGRPALLSTPLTPADFALGETRFRKQFRPLDPAAEGVHVAEYVELATDARAGLVPFVPTTDRDGRLVRMACSTSIVALVEDRRRHWQTLQHLAGGREAELTARHDEQLADLQARYDQVQADQEHVLDDIVRTMTELATASGAPVRPGVVPAGGPAPGVGDHDAGTARPPAAPVDVQDAVITLDPADQPLCNDCGTCYQELPQLFERTTMLVDGAPRTVAAMIPGALGKLELTPELQARIERVKATCDAEILR